MSKELDHERIWLQNAADANEQDTGRLWCEDKVWPDDAEDGEPTEYVRADLFASERARVAALEAALTKLLDEVEVDHPHGGEDVNCAICQAAVRLP